MKIPLTAVITSALTLAASAASVSLSLPSNWRDGERVDTLDGYTRISAPRLVAPGYPVAAPALPVYILETEIPKSATVTNITADVEWGDSVPLSAQILPIPAAVKYPDPVVIPEPDPEFYSLAAYPALSVEGGGSYLMCGKRRLIVRITPYRYNSVAGTIQRALSAVVRVEWVEGVEEATTRRATRLSAAAAGSQFVIISPPAFVDLWQAYVDYRADTHPDLTMEIVNTATIYADYPDVVAKGDYALAIHKYLEEQYNGGDGSLKTVLLGAGAPGRTSTGADANWHSFTNGFLAFDPNTQIPARYAIIEEKSAHEATDMYYACMDKTDENAAEVWDYDGDGIYMATLQSDGTMVNEASTYIDWAADLEVMRVPLQPLIVETTAGNRLGGDVVAEVTAEQQMTNFLAKIRYLESSEWKGAGRSAVLGESEIYGFGNNNKSRGNTSTEYLHEHEFFDGALNPWNTEREETIQSNETVMRYRAWQFAAGVRANGRIWHCVGADDALPDVYGSENDGYVSRTTYTNAIAQIRPVDHDAFNVFSHGWARGAAPLSSLDLMRGYYEGVTRVYFAVKPCESGMYDYSLGGQTITNRICLGGAAVLAPGGAAVSFNNSRYGVWYGLDYRTSSQLEGLVMSAAYNGNCTNMAFDVENPAVNTPITLGKALLLARQRAVVTDSNRFAKFNDDGSCLVEVTGFGDPLMTLSAQPDVEDDFSTECVRALMLKSNPDVSTTNSAAVLIAWPGVNSISGDGILRATVETFINEPELDFAVAGGMGRKVGFADAGGRLLFSGDKKRYVGPAFEKVGEIAVTGSGVTVDFGMTSDNASCPVDNLSFCASTFGTNTLRNADANMSSDFYSSTVGVTNSVLLAETSSPFPAALTNAELRIVTNPLWRGLSWDKTVELNNGLFSIAQDDFVLTDGATFNVVGDGGNSLCGGSVVDETASGKIAASGTLNVNLSNDGWFVFESPLQASDADGSLAVRGKGVLYLPHLPLVGYTNLVIGSATTLVLPGTPSNAVLMISGGTTSSVTFEGTPNVYCIEDESELSISYWGEPMNNPVVKGGTIVPDGASSVVDPPYARTLSSTSESWFNSTAWTGNGSPFTDTWANSDVYSGEVDLYVADGADEIELTVEGAVSASTLYVCNASGATAPGNLAIVATNNFSTGLIDATGYTGSLSLDFDLGSAALVANADAHVLGSNGTGKLTIPVGGRATLYTGEWLGSVENSGVLKRADTVSMASSELVAGTNSFVNGTITSEDTSTIHHFLVEDGDNLTIYGRKRAQGFNVTGGNLTFSQTSEGVWFGGHGKPYVQSGGAVTIDCAAASSSDPYNANTACNLQWTGTDAYFMTVSGGTFDVPNGYLLIWDNNATFTVTGEGVASAKGVSANASSPSNRRLLISDGGTFELGEFGFAPQSPATTISGGVLAATSDATVNAAITLINATLAASEGKTLTIAEPFDSLSGTLTIGTTNYTGTVDFGGIRDASMVFSTNSCGTVAVTVTDAEFSAGYVTLGVWEDKYTEPKLSGKLNFSNGASIAAKARIVSGMLRLVPVSRALPRPVAVWNSDFDVCVERGGYVFNANGNAISDDGSLALSAYGAVITNVMARATNHFAAVVGLTGVSSSSNRQVVASTVDSNSGKNVIFGFAANSSVLTGYTESWSEFKGDSVTWPGTDLHFFSFFYNTQKDTTPYGLRGFIDGEGVYSNGSLVYGSQYSPKTTLGVSIGGLPSAATAPLTNATLSLLAILNTTNSSDLVAWSSTGVTNAISVADGGSFGSGDLASTGVNLHGGEVSLSSSAVIGGLFVQADTTLVFADGASLDIVGPMYIADGAALTLDVSTAPSSGSSRALITAYSRVFESSQLATSATCDFATCSVSLDEDSGAITLTSTDRGSYICHEFNGDASAAEGCDSLTFNTGSTTASGIYTDSRYGQAINSMWGGRPGGYGLAVNGSEGWTFSVYASVSSTANNTNVTIVTLGDSINYGFGLICGGNGRVIFTSHPGGAAYETLASAAVENIEKYHLYTFIYDAVSCEMSFMVDGETIGVAAVSALNNTYFRLFMDFDNESSLGYDKSSGVYIDELRMYDWPLTAAEMTTLTDYFTPWSEDDDDVIDGFYTYANSLPSGLAPTNGVDFSAGNWIGTVLMTNVSASTLPLDWYGGSNSVLRLTGVSGYPGSSGNSNITFNTTINLVDGLDGAPALKINNGFSTDCTTISKLTGNGTFMTTKNPGGRYVYQGFVVNDASGFTGSLVLAGTVFTFGTTLRCNETNETGTIYIDAGYSVTNAVGATWSVSNLVVMGELVVRGALSVPNSVVFSNGASFVVGELPEGGVVLTSASITTNGTLSVGVLGDSGEYAAEIVDNGDGTQSLVMAEAGVAAEVTVPITIRHYNESTEEYEDAELNFDFPSAWLTNHYPTVTTTADAIAQYQSTAENGATVWQCYMLGLDPTDAESEISLSMSISGGKATFAVTGLGETHAIDGITVYWSIKTATDLTVGFVNNRVSATGLPPEFTAEHSIPDTPTATATETADTLFYKVTATFVAE